MAGARSGLTAKECFDSSTEGRTMASNMFRAVATGATLALTWSLMTLPSVDAEAAASLTSPVTAGVSARVSGDSTLSNLDVAGAEDSDLAPGFEAETHDYQIASQDATNVMITPTATDAEATTVITSAGTTRRLISGTATVPLTRGRNDIAVTVRSADGSSNTTYRVTAWRLVAPVSRIVGIADAHSTVFGGARMTVTLANGTLPTNCVRYYDVGEGGTQATSTSFDPATGLTKDVVSIPRSPRRVAGKVDLSLGNTCSGGSSQTPRLATSTAKNVVTYTAGFPVTSADIPATVTTGTYIAVHGTDVISESDGKYWIEDTQGRPQKLYSRGWDGEDISRSYVTYPLGGDWFKGSGQRTFHAGYCPLYQLEIDDACTSVLSRPLAWVEPAPQGVTFTPTSGPTAGGTKVTMRGRFIASNSSHLRITVGGAAVKNPVTVFSAEHDSDSLEQFLSAQDVVEFIVPARTAPGPAPVSVTNDVGTTLARSTFTYSAKPTITTVTPASAANSGGSTITLRGTSFGTAGSPTVMVNGTASPFVNRISASALTAVVPASGSVNGRVKVSVTSPQGGGVSAPAMIALASPSTIPTTGQLSPAAARTGDRVSISGAGFGAAGTVGVTVDGRSAKVIASTATTATFEVPARASAGVRPVRVAASTGLSVAGPSLTVLPHDAISTVSPSTIPSYAIGRNARITLLGHGFSASGTVQVGAAAAVEYTATAAGTRIDDVVVPTGAAGSQSVIVTPRDATTALRSTVTVTAPVLTYVGSDPRRSMYAEVDRDTSWDVGGQVLDAATAGGTPVRIEGSGFGPSGTVLIAGTLLTTARWTDTAVTFLAPEHAPGTVSVTLKPTGSSLSATRAVGVRYVSAPPPMPAIGRVIPAKDQIGSGTNRLNTPAVGTNLVTVTGVNLAAGNADSTRVVVSDESETFTVVPVSVTATTVTFTAPRRFKQTGWKSVEVITTTGKSSVSSGLYYLGADPANKAYQASTHEFLSGR